MRQVSLSHAARISYTDIKILLIILGNAISFIDTTWVSSDVKRRVIFGVYNICRMTHNETETFSN